MMSKGKLPDFTEYKIKAALFDLDGTLVDSMWVWDRLLIDFLTKYNIDMPDGILSEVAHMSMVQSSVYVQKELGLPMSPEEIRLEWTGMINDAYSHKIKTKPGAEAYLRKLKAENIYLGITTACDPVLCTACLKHNNIYNLFDTITYVDDVGKGKNFPDIFIECLRRLDCRPEEAVLFDDILSAIKTAKSIGMLTVAVEDGNDEAVKELIVKESDFYIRDFLE